MSKLERLLKLLTVLLDTSMPLPAEEIRNKIGGYPDSQGAFRRAFERDKDDLRSMGVNIRVEAVPGTDPPLDGYRVDAEEYAGRDPGLETDELAALHLAAALVRLDSLEDDAFWKLGGTGPEPADEKTPLATLPTAGDAATLYGAVMDRQLVEFGYRGEQRRLEPSRLTFTHGHWYVSGIDRVRDAERVFRLDRIEGPLVVGAPGSFDPVPTRGPEVTRPWEIGDGPAIRATVAIDAEEAVWAQVHLSPREIIEVHPDGTVVVELHVRNVDAFRDWLFGFLDHAEVIEPGELRNGVVEWLGAMA